MKLSASLFTSAFTVLVASSPLTPVLEKKQFMSGCWSHCTTDADCGGCANWCAHTSAGHQCLLPVTERDEVEDVVPLVKKAGEVSNGHCGGDADCPASSPYCWPTRVGGSCRDAPNPKLHKNAEDAISKRNSIPAIFKKEEAAACGGACSTPADCAYPCGNCHGGYCAGGIRATHEPSPLIKRINCGAHCSTWADCTCGICAQGRCGFGP